MSTVVTLLFVVMLLMILGIAVTFMFESWNCSKISFIWLFKLKPTFSKRDKKPKKEKFNLKKLYKIQNESFINELIKTLIDMGEEWESNYIYSSSTIEIKNKKRNLELKYRLKDGSIKDRVGVCGNPSSELSRREKNKVIMAITISERNKVTANSLGDLT